MNSGWAGRGGNQACWAWGIGQTGEGLVRIGFEGSAHRRAALGEFGWPARAGWRSVASRPAHTAAYCGWGGIWAGSSAPALYGAGSCGFFSCLRGGQGRGNRGGLVQRAAAGAGASAREEAGRHSVLLLARLLAHRQGQRHNDHQAGKCGPGQGNDLRSEKGAGGGPRTPRAAPGCGAAAGGWEAAYTLFSCRTAPTMFLKLPFGYPGTGILTEVPATVALIVSELTLSL